MSCRLTYVSYSGRSQARITNLHDIPTLVPYFFTDRLEPEYCHDGASMLESLMLQPETYSMYMRLFVLGIYADHGLASILAGAISKLDTAQWEVQTLHDLLEAEREVLAVKQKFYMMALRHALTGMKACALFPLGSGF